MVCIGSQDKYETVAEALQAAVVSLLADEDMKYKHSFFYWAGFICHGFAGVKLGDALLDTIHNRIESMCKESGDEEGDDGRALAVMTLTRDAYRRLDEREQALSREWCDKWNKTSN